MAKAAPDAMIDASVNYVAASTKQVACSAQPTTYNEANSTYALADIVVDSGDFAVADDTSGRKVTIAAQSGVTIDASGTATHIALVETAGSTLRYVTTCTALALTSGGTVDFPAWKINIADPT